MSILGLDIGTTGTKAVAFDLNGNVISSGYQEYPIFSPKPGWDELNPNLVWEAVKNVLGKVAGETKNDPIETLAISSQGEACVPVDKNGTTLANSIVTFDERTASYPDWWLKRKSRIEIAKITGMPLHGMYTINKIMWIRENQPEIFNKAVKFFCFEDYIQFKLGLDPVISSSLAARTMAYDVKKGDWSEEMLSLAGLDKSLFSKTAYGGTIVGVIPDQIASEIGLPKGVKVATGGHDQPAGALGGGILASGEAMLAFGTVVALCPVFDKFNLSSEMVNSNLCCYDSCIEGLYSSLAFNFTGGSLIKWYRDNFAFEEMQIAKNNNKNVYDIICENVPSEPENLLVLPHFTMTGTPYFDTKSRGIIAGLTLQTKKEEIISALISGIAYEMKLNLSVLQSNNINIERIRLVGGGAKSSIISQRFADVMGVPIAIPKSTEAGALGVAMLGAKANGLCNSLKDFAENAVKIEMVYEPNKKKTEEYKKRFLIYKDLYNSMKNINKQISSL